MRFLSALVAGALALQASAFLVPLEVSEAAEHVKTEISALLGAGAVTVDLDCPGCLFAPQEPGEEWVAGVENRIHLSLDADFEHGLLINGQRTILSGHAKRSPLTASQLRVEDGTLTEPLPLGYVLERLGPVTSPKEHNKRITPIRFTITSIGGHPVKVDTVTIDLLETSYSTNVVRVSTIPFKATPGATTCSTESRWSLCRLRAMIKAQLEQMMAKGKTHAEKANGWMKGGCRGKQHGHKSGGKAGHDGHHGHGKHPHPHHHKDHPHHHPHHPHHHQHHKAHRIGHMFHQALRFFIIPALLGVIGGLMASAVGMVVGQLITYLWFRFHRNGQRGNIRVVEIVVDEDEKTALMIDEEDEHPPQYQDRHEDEDVEAVVVMAGDEKQ